MPSHLNLGLESLIDSKTENEAKVLSYEYLDAVFEYSAASEELTVVFNQFDSVIRAAENLKAVSDVIATQGVTPALEALVGENFKRGLSAESVSASLESVGEAIKNFCLKIWQAIKQFFLKFFTSTKGMRERLLKFKQAAAEAGAELEAKEFTGIKLESLKSITGAPALEKGFSDLDIKKYGDPIDKITLGSVQDAVAYADKLYHLLTDYDKNKDAYLKVCDAQIEVAKKLADEAASKDEVAKAKAAKDLINKAFKAVYSSAAAFLAHNSIKGQKPAEKPAEGDQKPDEGK